MPELALSSRQTSVGRPEKKVGPLIDKEVILRLPNVLGSLDPGVSAVVTRRRNFGKIGWSDGVLKKDIKPLAIAPVLQCPETNANSIRTRQVAFFGVIAPQKKQAGR
jgi:hypothetical protein